MDLNDVTTDVKKTVDDLNLPQLPKDKNSWKDILKIAWAKVKSWLNSLWVKIKGWLLGWLK